jgi:hypothetical protein
MSKKCNNCGAPQGSSEVDNCIFCGNVLQLDDLNSSLNHDFTLIQYEFVRRNYRRVIQLCDNFLEREKSNIPIWTIKIIAESYKSGEKGALSRIVQPLSAAFKIGIINEKNKRAVEKVLGDEISEKLKYLVSDAESKRESIKAISLLKDIFSEAFIENLLSKIDTLPDFVGNTNLLDISERDSLFEDAARLIVQHQSGSTSLLQRRMKLGYNRAGRLMDQLEIAGVVGPAQGSAPRAVLFKTEAQLENYLMGQPTDLSKSQIPQQSNLIEENKKYSTQAKVETKINVQSVQANKKGSFKNLVIISILIILFFIAYLFYTNYRAKQIADANSIFLASRTNAWYTLRGSKSDTISIFSEPKSDPNFLVLALYGGTPVFIEKIQDGFGSFKVKARKNKYLIFWVKIEKLEYTDKTFKQLEIR